MSAYIDYQQRRRRDADIIDEAIASYDSWCLDDDFDTRRCLDSIIERMKKRRAMVAPSPPELERERLVEVLWSVISKWDGATIRGLRDMLFSRDAPAFRKPYEALAAAILAALPRMGVEEAALDDHALKAIEPTLEDMLIDYERAQRKTQFSNPKWESHKATMAAETEARRALLDAFDRAEGRATPSPRKARA